MAVVYRDLVAKMHLIISCIEDGVRESLLWSHEVQRGQPLCHWAVAYTGKTGGSTPPPQW